VGDVGGYYTMPPSVSKLRQERMQISQGLISLFTPQHSWHMGIGNSPVLIVCSQIILCKSVPSTFQGHPHLLECQLDCTLLLIKKSTQGTWMRDQQGRKRFKRGPCYAWNDGMCMAQQCQWEHVCSKCAGDHSGPMCSLGSSPTEAKQEEKK